MNRVFKCKEYQTNRIMNWIMNRSVNESYQMNEMLAAWCWDVDWPNGGLSADFTYTSTAPNPFSIDHLTAPHISIILPFSNVIFHDWELLIPIFNLDSSECLFPLLEILIFLYTTTAYNNVTLETRLWKIHKKMLKYI